MTGWRLSGKTVGHEFFLGHLVVHEQHVGIAAAAHVDGLAGAQATTFTSMPLAFLNSGSRWPNRPDCSVEVVDATTMDWRLRYRNA